MVSAHLGIYPECPLQDEFLERDSNMTLLRTLLFVPANRENMLAKAQTLPADVVVIDLEDAVPPAEKDSARNLARSAIESLKAAGKSVHVRVNHLTTGLTKDDLTAAVGPGLDGILMPKVNGASQVRELDVLLREQELHSGVRPGTIALFPMIESARGVLRCEEIAIASTRIAGLALGGEDYAADLGIARTPEGRELDHARRVIVHVCAAYRLRALDAIYTNLHDEPGLLADAHYARSIGFSGKYVVHPDQIEPVNRVFSPTQAEVESARKIVSAFEAAEAQGLGTLEVDGQMVDIPVVKRARATLATADAIAKASPT
jgi:citrate lyase subunit beta / citryl-CoA lyase